MMKQAEEDSGLAAGFLSVVVFRPAIASVVAACACRRPIAAGSWTRQGDSAMERPWVVRATTTLSIVVYLAVGVAAFMANETKPCESSAAPASAADDACTEPLTFIDALYMAIITISTVGYGDFSPKSTGMKVFTIIYILVGTTYVHPPLAHTYCPHSCM